jgi:phosphatidylinositol alpha-mannosyltransferase
MKIGIVGDDTLDKTDGVEQYILTVGRWLSEQGHEVHYLVGETRRTDLPHLHSLTRNVKVRFNGNRLSIPLPANKRRLKILLQKENFDVLYVQMPYSPFLAGRIVKAAGTNTAVVGIFHILPHTWLTSVGTRLLRLWLSRSIKRFDSFLSVSTAAQAFSKTFPEYDDKLVVLFHGRLVERKGCGYFLQAVAKLYHEERWPEGAIVLISGAGPLAETLQEYVTREQLNEVVTFLGYTTEDDKPRYMASADVTVYPSTGGESFGIVLIESMAASRGAVLAGNNAGYASVMHPRPGSLFNPKDIPAFAEILFTHLSGKKLRSAAHDWQQTYVKQYDVSVVGKQLVAVFKEALRKRRS